MLNIIYKGKNVPCCHKASCAVSLCRDQSRSRRERARCDTALRISLSKFISTTLGERAALPKATSNEQELINPQCCSSKGPAQSGSVGRAPRWCIPEPFIAHLDLVVPALSSVWGKSRSRRMLIPCLLPFSLPRRI